MSAAAYALIFVDGAPVRRDATKALAIVGWLASFGLLLSSGIDPIAGWRGVGLPDPLREASAWYDARFPAGLLVIALPFLISEWRAVSRRRVAGLSWFWLAGILLAITSVVASGSLAFILTLFLAAFFIVVWRLSSGLSGRFGWPRRWSLAVLGAAGSAVAIPLLLLTGRRIASSSVGSVFVAGRLELAQQSARLA